MLVKNDFVKNPQTWCGLNRPGMKEEEADVVIFGIPFDGGVSYRGGAAEAPETLRENTLCSTPCTERLQWFGGLNVVDAGDFQDGGREDRDVIFAEVEKYVGGAGQKRRALYHGGRRPFGDHSCGAGYRRRAGRGLRHHSHRRPYGPLRGPGRGSPCPTAARSGGRWSWNT